MTFIVGLNAFVSVCRVLTGQRKLRADGEQKISYAINSSVGPPLTLTHRLELRSVEVTGYSLMAMCPLAMERRSVSSPGQWDASGTILLSLPLQHLRLPPFTQGTYGA